VERKKRPWRRGRRGCSVEVEEALVGRKKRL
jgi:hypothetical protein